MTNMIYTAMPALPKKHHTNAVVLPSEWNTCPLSSIVEEISETVGTRKIETISISAGIGFVNQAEKFGRELSGKQYEKYIVLHKGDFSYNKGNSNIYPQGCIYRLNNRTEAAVPNVFESFRVSVGNPDYYEQLFLSGFLNRQLYSKINRGVRDNGLLNLKGKDFYSCEVPYPPLAEQERIAEILIQCDRVIEVKEQKLDELKQLKKEFLRKMFPAKGCDTPEIRFPGFTGAWEQRKLGEIYGLIGNAFVGTATPYYVEQGHFYLESNNVKDGQINHNSEIFINDEFYEKQKDKWLHTGDMVMVQSGHVGHAAVIPEVLDNTAAHALIMFRNPKEKIEPYFLNFEYQTNKSKKKIENITTGNTIKHILASDMQEFEVDVPKYEEQKAIAEYFANLDNLITLHQRELEETKTYKTAADRDCPGTRITTKTASGVSCRQQDRGK